MTEHIVSSLRLITAPAVEPITLIEARLHLRLDAEGSPLAHPDDDIVTALISTAREYMDGRDGILGRCLITQTWELVLDEFPSAEIKVPLPPLQTISSIKYDDADGIERTITASNYLVDTSSQPGWVVPISTYTWPSTLDGINTVRVRFVAGYGVAVDVPVRIKQAMLLLIGHWYQQRESVLVGPIATDLPMGVDALLTPLRVWGFGG